MPFFSSKNRLLVLLIIFFLLANVRIVLASSCANIDIIQAIRCGLAEDGIDEDTIKETTAALKVLDVKKQAPQVKLAFTPTSPAPGEEITATAQTLYFSNNADSLYYSWYLQPEYCREENLNAANKTRCDLNHDGDVDIEDFKIKAMRIYVGNDFEWDTINYNDANIEDDKDGYKAIMGGDDQKDKNNFCYFYDTNLGKEYTFQSCFHLFPDAPGYTTGDEKFNEGEEYFWRTNPDDPDTAETGHPDEANVVGLNARNFTWTYQSGDRIGVVVEGVSVDPTLYKDSSYKIMWAVPNNTCGNLEDYIKAPGGSEDDYATEISPTDWPDCPDGCTFTRTVTKRKTIDKKQSDISSATVSSYKLFTKTETIVLPSRRRVAGEGTTTLDAFSFGPEEVAICNANDTADLVTNGFFTQAEVDSDEKYQVALDTNKSCCDSSFEADTSAACALGKDPEISITEEIADINTAPEDSLFTMTKDNFNTCLLEKNLLTPTEGGGKNEKIEVSLSSSPANPVNDTSDEGDNADWINIVSTIENSTKSESLHYSWTVYAGDSADSDGEWGDPLLKSQLVGVEQTVGAGIPNLKFKANFTDAPKYLKVKLNVSEKVTSGTGEGTRKGHAEVIIPLSSFNNKLSVFNTSVSDSLILTQGSEEICKTLAAVDPTTLVDAAVCQVAPDEIIAVKANIVLETGETWADYDFLWELDDRALSYKYDSSYTNSTFKPGNSIFFPVLAEKGSALDLSLIATNQKTGAKISLNKTFLVSEPTFKIISTDEATSKPKLLGKYIDLDGKEWPDYSQTEFLALNDATIKLALAPFASFPLPNSEDLSVKWYWNEAQLATTERSLSFNANQETEKSFSLKAEGLYTQDINTKKALRDYWGVTLGEFYEQQLSQTIDFTLADSIDDSDSTVAQKGRGKILASFISSVPAYFAFLFRLVMTAFVMLAAIWILFALFPQAQKND